MQAALQSTSTIAPERSAEALVVLPPELRHSSPYPGFRPFRSDEADIFFGRDKDVDALLGRLASRFIAVMGPSGCGKSSLVRAGFIPRVSTRFRTSAGATWRVAEMRPGQHPVSNLARALMADRALGPEWNNDPTAIGLLEATLRRGSLGLVQAFQESLLPDDSRLLLLVDQFEELFRNQSRKALDEVEAFVALLTGTVAANIPIHIVITMRSDCVGDCAAYYGLSELISNGMFLTPRMSRDQCSEAIIKPARLLGGTVEPELVNRLLNEVGAIQDPLPPLQHVLMRLWKLASGALVEANQPVAVGMAHYAQVGTLERALSNHANEAYEALAGDDQPVAEILFRSLVDVSVDNRKLRRKASIGTVASRARVEIGVVERVVNAFLAEGRSFLVRSGEPAPSAEAEVDISHESLIRLWDRLKQWSEEEARWLRARRLLRESATQWEENSKHPQYLLRGRRLRDATELEVRYPGEQSTLEKNFTAESTTAVWQAPGDEGISHASSSGVWWHQLWTTARGQVSLLTVFQLLDRAKTFGPNTYTQQPDVIDDGYAYDACLVYAPEDHDCAESVERFLVSFDGASKVDPRLSLRKIRLESWSPTPTQEPLGTERALDARLLFVFGSRVAGSSTAINDTIKAFLARRPRKDVLLLLVEGEPEFDRSLFPPAIALHSPLTWFDLRGIKSRRRRRQRDPKDELVRIAALINGNGNSQALSRAWRLWRVYWGISLAMPFVLLLVSLGLVIVGIVVSQRRQLQEQNQAILAQKQEFALQNAAARKVNEAGKRASELSSLLTRAATAASEQHYVEAIDLYENALQHLDLSRDPKSEESRSSIQKSLGPLYLKSGRLQAMHNELDQAIDSYTKAVSHGSSYEALMSRGIAKRQLKRDSDAIADMLAAISNAASSREVRIASQAARSVLGDIANNAQGLAQQKAKDELAKLPPTARMFLHYVQGSDPSSIALINKELSDNAFLVLGLESNSSEPSSSVSYYFVQDKDTAQDLADAVSASFVKLGQPAPVKVTFVSVTRTVKSPGMLALFLQKVHQAPTTSQLPTPKTD